MLGFKQFETAAITISGIELAEKIRKDQFKTGKLSGKPRTAPEIWAAILAARRALDHFWMRIARSAKFAPVKHDLRSHPIMKMG
jgi:hypothetical protein